MHLNFALLAAAGGALGAAARYLMGALALRLLGPQFPWGTLAVNVAGCFLMGLIAGFAIYRHQLSPELRMFLATGVLGGFTTFSAFALDAFFLYEERGAGLAALYVAASVIVSLAALLGGLAITRLFS